MLPYLEEAERLARLCSSWVWADFRQNQLSWEGAQFHCLTPLALC